MSHVQSEKEIEQISRELNSPRKKRRIVKNPSTILTQHNDTRPNSPIYSSQSFGFSNHNNANNTNDNNNDNQLTPFASVTMLSQPANFDLRAAIDESIQEAISVAQRVKKNSNFLAVCLFDFFFVNFFCCIFFWSIFWNSKSKITLRITIILTMRIKIMIIITIIIPIQHQVQLLLILIVQIN